MYIHFEATLLVGDLPGVFWNHTWQSGCVYLFPLGSFERDGVALNDSSAPLFRKPSQAQASLRCDGMSEG